MTGADRAAAASMAGARGRRRREGAMLGQALALARVGAAAGWLATRIMNVRLGVPQTIAVGVLGALIGGFAVRIVLPLLGGILGAVAGACLLIWLFRRYGDRLK
jgi:uncharacterized membrane protein YeaQ/YmgE (transglycosylase-associated protein family)